MKRPQPTKQLVMELTSGRNGRSNLVRPAHHGLYETPLDGLYTNLNLDEVIAFAGASWQLRDGDLRSFAALVRSEDIYEIFSRVFQDGFRQLNGNKWISEEQRDLYEKLNPYKGRTLRERLERADPKAVETLIDRLQQDTNYYITEGQLNNAGEVRAGGNKRRVTMAFLPTHPKKGQTAQHYAAEVSNMLRSYPQEYAPLEVVRPRVPANQLSMF